MILSFGEIILRLTTVSNQKLEQASFFEAHWGGSEANVMINLSLLNNSCRFLTRLPDSALGTTALRKLSQYKIDTSFTSRGGSRLGLYYLEQGSSLRPGKILYDRENASVNALTVEEIEWDSLFEGITWVHWSGITPALSENAAAVNTRMVREAAERNLPVSCDLHYRSTLWNYGKSPGEVIPELLRKTNYLVGDPHAIRQMTGNQNNPGGEHLSDDQLFRSFTEIRTLFPSLKAIGMLSRQVQNASDNTLHGVLYDGDCYSSSDFHIVPVTDRIGGGDAFMAGLIDGFLKDVAPEKTIAWATALAAYKHTVPGDHLSGELSDFRTFAEKGNGELKR